MLTELTISQRALADYMSGLSEEAYCAGWMKGLEHELWAAVLNGPKIFGRLSIEERHIEKLQTLSENCGGWIIFDEISEEKWVSLQEWKERYDPSKVVG